MHLHISRMIMIMIMIPILMIIIIVIMIILKIIINNIYTGEVIKQNDFAFINQGPVNLLYRKCTINNDEV